VGCFLWVLGGVWCCGGGGGCHILSIRMLSAGKSPLQAVGRTSDNPIIPPPDSNPVAFIQDKYGPDDGPAGTFSLHRFLA